MLTPLYLEKTEYTPEVILDSKQGVFQIKGYFCVKDSRVPFDQTIINWLKTYSTFPNTTTTLCFDFVWVDDIGVQVILEILPLLKELPHITIEWYTSKEDEDMREFGKELSMMFAIPFKHIIL